MGYVMYTDWADTDGADPGYKYDEAVYPEAFAQFCRENFSMEYPDLDIHVFIGHGSGDLYEKIDPFDLWVEYRRLPKKEAIRLSRFVPKERRDAYLKAKKIAKCKVAVDLLDEKYTLELSPSVTMRELLVAMEQCQGFRTHNDFDSLHIIINRKEMVSFVEDEGLWDYWSEGTEIKIRILDLKY